MLNIYSKYTDDIIEIVTINENLVVYDYKGKENQILVTKELVDKILNYTQAIQEKIDLKDFLKFSIREIFELQEHDIVISKNGHIFIKLVEKIKKVEVPLEKQDTISNRYNGFTEEEVKSFYAEFFEEEENKDFFPSIAREFVNIYFHEKKINNEIYEKNAFGYIHSLTLEHLVEMYDNSDGFFKGFAGYIFRVHFKEVFEYIADIILEEISIDNSYMAEFLNYYSSDVIVVGGYKFKVPVIAAKDGLRWNVISMLSIAKVYTKTEKSIVDLRKKTSRLNEEISALYINHLSPIEYHTFFIKSKQKLEIKISDTNKKLDRYVHALRTARNEQEKKNVRMEIKLIEENIRDLLKEKEELSTKMLKPSVVSKYKELQNIMDTLVRQMSNAQRIITQNKETYISMRNSLVQALISKKKQI